MDKSGYKQAGGFILAASIIAGVVGGIVIGQPSIGFLVGAAARGRGSRQPSFRPTQTTLPTTSIDPSAQSGQPG